MSDVTARDTWRSAILCVSLALAALLAAHAETCASIVSVWRRSETFAHGFAVLPISAYLVWRQRAAVARIAPRPGWAALPILLGLEAVWLIGRLADVLALQHLSVVLLLPACVILLLGWRVGRALAFPLAYLIFAAPIGMWVVPWLTDFTVGFVIKALHVTGVPIAREGRYLFLPGGSWVISRACSGVRYLIASLALGSLFAYLYYRSPRRRLLFMLAALVTPVLANGVRAYLVVMLGYLSNMKIATGIDHIIYGWIFFLLVMMALFAVGLRWEERDPPSVPAATGPGEVGFDRVSSGAMWGAAALALAVIAGGLGGDRMLRGVEDATPMRQPVLAPQSVPPWEGPYDAVDSWRPTSRGSDAEARNVYYAGLRAVQLYIAWYGEERQGAELVNSENVLYDGHLWKRVSEQEREIQAESGARLRVHETRIRCLDETRLVWSWYIVGGTETTSPFYAKFLEARRRLTRSYVGAAIIAVAARERVGSPVAEQALRDFIARMYPAIRASLGARAAA